MVTLPREFIRTAARYLGYAVAFFIFAAVVNWFQAPKPKADKIAALELTTLDGKPMILQTAAGKKTVIYFFAPWCTVCKLSMDAMNMFAGGDVQAVAIGLDYEQRHELAAFQSRIDVPILAGTVDIQRRFQVDRYPTVYILNGDGSVRHTMAGYASRFGIWIRTKL